MKVKGSDLIHDKILGGVINENISNINPQVVEMITKEEARIEAFEDVLRYIENGQKYGFRSFRK